MEKQMKKKNEKQKNGLKKILKRGIHSEIASGKEVEKVGCKPREDSAQRGGKSIEPKSDRGERYNLPHRL
jgi:hypothetical protein